MFPSVSSLVNLLRFFFGFFDLAFGCANVVFLNSCLFVCIRGQMVFDVLISIHQRKSAVKKVLIFLRASVPPWWVLVLDSDPRSSA